MEKFLSSRIGLKFGLTLARTTPPWLGYAIAKGVARWISIQKSSDLVHAARLNQWLVSGKSLEGESLNQAVHQNFQHHARSIYDLYHNFQDLTAAGGLFKVEPTFQDLIKRPKFDQRGRVVAGLHMSGFDLAFQWLCPSKMDPLSITIPNPQGARMMEFQMRTRSSLSVVPGSVAGLRQALRYLKRGRLVVTGIDHPQEGHPCPRFFGYAAPLPTHHIFLALKAKVPVVVAATRINEAGIYTLSASDPIEMDSCKDRNEALLHNSEKVLAEAEVFIRESPHQWLISKPVWPELSDQVPI
jgi:lauroyl/myristoyl acyltransferase